MFKKASTQDTVTSVFVLLWIFFINIATLMVTSAPAWPMFFVTIFFFTLGGDTKQIPSIFLGGIVGISFAFVLMKLLGLFAPLIGELAATALLIFIVLAMIIVGGNSFPLIFNNITFVYLTICAIDMSIIIDSTVEWLIMLVVGGSIILIGAMVIFMLVGKVFSRKADTAAAKI